MPPERILTMINVLLTDATGELQIFIISELQYFEDMKLES